MAEEFTEPQEKESQEQTITVRVNKYKSLVDALGRWSTTLRVVFTVFLLGVLLFVGIAFITLAIKKLYPYSDITTNGLGATTIKSERNEVSYWLLNTANLWADSGIAVKEGDIITVRSSGKSYTAIHHIYDAASGNEKPKDKWVGAEGEPDDDKNEANKARRKFRIFPNLPSGALLMQVAVDESLTDTPLEHNNNHPNSFYFIGKERQNIYITNSGTLHFAVNDIVLDRRTIVRMMYEAIENKGAIDILNDLRDKGIDKEQLRTDSEIKDADAKLVNERFKEVFEDQIALRDGTTIGKMALGRSGDECELSYYLEKDYKTAWYDDNIGSFLIMVEKIK